MKINKNKVAVVIPCYKVKKHIIKVIQKVEKFAKYIIVVDDNSPQNEKKIVKEKYKKKQNLFVISLEKNQGVGGATLAGYKKAIKINEVKYIFKIDGDDQMNHNYMPKMLKILYEGADYIKGNRFKSYLAFHNMPVLRIFGNIIYSFLTKLSSGFYHIGDAHNGYTCIKKDICKKILQFKISKRYFFEPDFLYHLYNLNAKVKDIHMNAIYKNEISNVNYLEAIVLFPLLHIKNFYRRIILNYLLRDFSFASVCFFMGFFSFLYSTIFLGYNNYINFSQNQQTPVGTIVLGTTILILSFQMLIIFFSIDYQKSNQIKKNN